MAEGSPQGQAAATAAALEGLAAEEAACHVECWRGIAGLAHGQAGLVLAGGGGGVAFHRQWRALLWEHLGGLASGWELFLLDAWGADGGWGGGSAGGAAAEAGVHSSPARCARADAYMLTPAAARWLLEQQRGRLGLRSHVCCLAELQARGRAFASTPKLALRVCGSASSDERARGFSEAYHEQWPREFYDYE